MYFVYGRKGCTRCEIAKRLLTKKGELFEYSDLGEMDSAEADEIVMIARENARIQLPLIFKDGIMIDITDIK